MSLNNDFVNLSYVPKDKKESLKNTLYAFLDRQKNFNRLDTLVTSECSKLCLSNFKSDKLNSEENVCLTNCFAKFYDTLDLGEHVYDKLSKRQVDISPLA
jgi:hypothetical protein